MRVLVLGLDKNILDETSAVRRRARQYASQLDWYGVVVPAKKNEYFCEKNLEIWGSGGRNKLCQLIRLARLAKRLIKEKNIDVISVQDIYFLGLVGIWLGRKFHRGVEIQLHGIEKMNILRQEAAQKVFQQADSIRVVGDVLKDKLVNYFGIAERKIVTVPIFLNWKELKYKRFDRDLKKEWQDNFVFLTVSRLVPIKNVGGMIKAFSQVVKEQPQALLIVVGDGPMLTKLESLASDLGIQDNIEFMGWQKELENFYRNADCYVYFSQQEGYGMSLIESLSYQLPVITTNVGIVPQVIKDGENGLIVKQADIESLATMMKLVMVNKELLASLKKNTRKYLTTLPTEDEIIKLYKQSWQKAIDNRSK